MTIEPITLLFTLSLILGLVLTPLWAKLAVSRGIVDKPAHRKTHTQNIPYMGGPAVFSAAILGLVATGLATSLMVGYDQAMIIKTTVILVPALGVMAVGLWDDCRNIAPRTKFVGQLVFALLFAQFGFRFEMLHVPGLPATDLPPLFAVPLTAFWIVSIINAFNMVDGVDGLAASVGASSLFLIAIGSAYLGSEALMTLSLCLLGAVLGFLYHNWKPAKVYLGDAGSNGLGMFVAAALLAMGKGRPIFMHPDHLAGIDWPFRYQVFVLTLMVAHPVLEICLSVARRMFRGKPITRADNGHIHHRLVNIGLRAPQICLIAVGASLLPGMAALSLISRHLGWATWLLALSGMIFGVSISVLGFLKFLDPKAMEHLRPHYRIAHHFIEMQKIKLTQVDDRREVLALINGTCREFGVQSYRFFILQDNLGKGGLDYAYDWVPLQQKEYLNFIKRADGSKPEAPISDRYEMPNHRGEAQWTFQPNLRLNEGPHQDDSELDVEYRVLVHDFMKEALEAALRVGKGRETLLVPAVAPISGQGLRGHALRRKVKLRVVGGGLND